MNEHTFEQADGRCYDFAEMLDELRCHSSKSLHLARMESISEQRWWHLRELAVTAVLDERGQVDDSTAARDGTTTRDARRTRATAKKLVRQPHVANAAAAGRLSPDQLAKVADLAGDDPEADRRGPSRGRAGRPMTSPTSCASGGSRRWRMRRRAGRRER